jgi:hypothetical protein
LKVEGMTLLPHGDLLWDGKASAVKPFALMELAARTLFPGVKETPLLPDLPASDRHPIQLAEPVLFGGYTVPKDDPLRLEFRDGAMLPVAMNRLSPCAELPVEEVRESGMLLGLLRFDTGQWGVQPLAVAGAGRRGAESFVGSGATEAVTNKKNRTLAILQERASRLLRAKS